MSSARGYAERPPAPGLRDLLSCTWTRRVRPGDPASRIVPDGCADLIWTGSRLFLAGPDTGPHLDTPVPGTMTGVRFAPGVAPAFLGLPAAEVRDARPDLADLPGLAEAAGRLADRLAAGADPVRALQSGVAAHLRRDALDPVAPAVLAALSRGAGVRELADRLGLTERGLHRRSVAAFGYGPKVLQRILRFQAAVTLARAGSPHVDTAHALGYADQPHLAREVRALAGVPLTQLLSPSR